MNTTVLFPRRAALHAVSPRSRRLLLDALEVAPSVSCSEAALLSGLNEKTVRNACRLLAREGILDGRSAGAEREAIRIARYPSLPMLDIRRAYTLLRLGDTRLDSVFAVMRDADGRSSREEDLGQVFHRARGILKSGLPTVQSSISPAQPVVLYEDQAPTPRRMEQIRCGFATLGTALPPLTVPVAEAMAAELSFLPETQGASLVLCIATRPCLAARMFARERGGTAFLPLSLMATLQSPSVISFLAGGESTLSRVVELVTRVRGILPVDCVILETDAPMEACVGNIPSGIGFHTRFADLNTPSLAHRGALRLSRRRLWESMTES